MKSSLEQLKESKKLEILLSQSRVGILGGCLVTTLVIFVFWNRTQHAYLISWFSFYMLLSGLRYYFTSNVSLENLQIEKIDRIRIAFTIFTCLSGISWGVMSVIILQADTLTYGLFIIIVAMGMTASGATLYAIYPSVLASFAVPALLPQAVFLLLHNGEIENVYGYSIFLFLFIVSLSIWRLRKLVLESISIQFENIRLLDDIEREKVQVSDLNKQLQTDLKDLRKRDMQLSEERDKAEDLAKKLLILSSRDGLTGIANRRHFDEFLAKEWNRSVRSGSELALIMCDIDHFKDYNDCYGHQQGDLCLQRISGILEEYSRREGDLAARYGGEEFAIVMSDTTLENAVHVAEKIRTAVEKTAIPHDASVVANIVTISVGVASIQPDQDVFASVLIAEADRYLYQAKAQGRNRVASAPIDDVTVQKDKAG